MIPISTDAPLYYNPFATIGLIVINVICFFTFCFHPGDQEEELVVRTPDGKVLNATEFETELEKFQSEEERDEWMASIQFEKVSTGWLEFLMLRLDAIRPWQWITCNFMHADIIHLIGNMIFLWAFGLIVEGKVGAAKFIAIYFSIGIIQAAMIQVCCATLQFPGYVLGASSAIFGLLAFCIVWAPANEFDVLYIGYGAGMFEMSILLYGGLFFIKEVVFFILSGFSFDSELLHLVGFGVGLPFAIAILRSGLVDCEGWDVFSYLAGTTGKQSKIAKSFEKKERDREKKRRKYQARESFPPKALRPMQRVPLCCANKSLGRSVKANLKWPQNFKSG